MLRMFIGMALTAAILATPGCGGGANPLPPEVGSADYAQKSGEKMKEMYGIPKPTSVKRAQNPSDMIKAMSGAPKPPGSPH